MVVAERGKKIIFEPVVEHFFLLKSVVVVGAVVEI